MASRFDEVVEQHAAEFDYQWKRNAKRFHQALGVLADAATPFGAKDKAASE